MLDDFIVKGCRENFVCFYKVEDNTCDYWECWGTECTAYCECESCMKQDNCSIRNEDD